MANAVRIYNTGDPSVMRLEEFELPALETNHVLIKQTAIGLNYIDVYVRSGLYPLNTFPTTIGMEAAGIVEAIGPEVSELSVGDRVAYPMQLGAYADYRTIAASSLVAIPDNISDRIAASIMLKGLTAHYLLRRTYHVKKGDPILIYAAAGGVGLILSQWAKHLGAMVIGCAGSVDKANLAKRYGCDHVILYKEQNVTDAVKEITNGEGVAVAYDSVGKDTFQHSMDSLRPFGTLVTFGNSSGKVEPFSPSILGPKGSLYVTRPTLATHIATRPLLLEGATRLFSLVENGIIEVNCNQTYTLNDIIQAHTDLEGRKTTGSTIILPQ